MVLPTLEWRSTVLQGKLGQTLDALLLGALPLGTLAQILPPVAALVSIVYGLIKIYESETVQNLLKRRKDKE